MTRKSINVKGDTLVLAQILTVIVGWIFGRVDNCYIILANLFKRAKSAGNFEL